MLNATDRRLLTLALGAVLLAFVATAWTTLATVTVGPANPAQNAAIRLAVGPAEGYAERLAETRAELDRLPASDASREAREALAAYSSKRDTAGFAEPEVTRRMLAGISVAEQQAAFDRRRLANFWVAALAIAAAALAAASVTATWIRLRHQSAAIPAWATMTDRAPAEMLAEELAAVEAVVEELKTERIALAREVRERDERIRELKHRAEIVEAAPPSLPVRPEPFSYVPPPEEPMIPLEPLAGAFRFESETDLSPLLPQFPETAHAFPVTPVSRKFAALASLCGTQESLEASGRPLVAVTFPDLGDFELAYDESIAEVYLNTATTALFKSGATPDDVARSDRELLWAIPRCMNLDRTCIEREIGHHYADELVEFEGRLVERPSLHVRVVRESLDRRLAETDRRVTI